MVLHYSSDSHTQSVIAFVIQYFISPEFIRLSRQTTGWFVMTKPSISSCYIFQMLRVTGETHYCVRVIAFELLMFLYI